jgi:AraC-like DNA-binding protein
VFPQHYLLYVSQGSIQLEIENVTWTLPPQRAAWIAAGTEMSVISPTPFTTASVLFSADHFKAPEFACRVFPMSLLAKEMVGHAMRWGPDRDPNDQSADAFFSAIADVCAELYLHSDEFWLPRPQSPGLARVVAAVLGRLDQPMTLAEAAEIAAVSERTLARRFLEETSMNWSQFMLRARMIRAMELLVIPNSKVHLVALAVGFESQSAFISAFKKFAGESPSRFRERLI